MRRWILKADQKDLNALTLQDVPKPEPGPGEVRIRVHAVSLNFRDQLILKGVFGRIPGRDLVPISDGSGEIDAVGPGVTAWKPGDKVVSLYFDWQSGLPKPYADYGVGSLNTDGMLAEYVVLPATRVVRAPESLDYGQAATLPCAALTAWNALFYHHPVGPRSKVLVLGTGGVSLFALLLARAAGAQVFATSSQESKREALLAMGAAQVVNYRTTPDWAKAIFDLTGGVNKVVDAAGTVNESINALGFGGEVALMGLMAPSEGPLPAMVMMAKGASVRATGVGSAEMFADLAATIDRHMIKPPIAKHFPFSSAPDAFTAQTGKDTFGKIVIDVV